MTAFRLSYLASLLVGIGYLSAGWEQPLGTLERPGDGFFPLIVGAVFSLLSLVALIQSLRPVEGPATVTVDFPRGADLRRVSWITTSLVLFAALFRILGFHLCTAALMVAVLRIISPWKWLKIVLVSLVLTLLSFLLFQKLLGVPLPRGSIWG